MIDIDAIKARIEKLTDEMMVEYAAVRAKYDLQNAQTSAHKRRMV